MWWHLRRRRQTSEQHIRKIPMYKTPKKVRADDFFVFLYQGSHLSKYHHKEMGQRNFLLFELLGFGNRWREWERGVYLRSSDIAVGERGRSNYATRTGERRKATFPPEGIELGVCETNLGNGQWSRLKILQSWWVNIIPCLIQPNAKTQERDWQPQQRQNETDNVSHATWVQDIQVWQWFSSV